MNSILLTGATGFLGGGLLARLAFQGNHHLTVSVRNFTNISPAIGQQCLVPHLGAEVSWQHAVESREVVVHCAARVHVMNAQSSSQLAEFRKVNVEGTLNLASQAAAAGVRRFIFISSIKVNGEETTLGMPYFADAQPAATDPYGISKMEAEQGLRAIAATTGMEVVIIRPVLVYGPGVKANFLSMMRWLHRGMPLPFAAIHNRRSLVALDNLIDLIVTCIDHPAAANQTFLVSDGEDLSTSDLLRRMGAALGKPARLLPVPSRLLESGALMLGKQALAQRLCRSLQVDISKTRELLAWSPPVGVDEALRRTAVHFLTQQRAHI